MGDGVGAVGELGVGHTQVIVDGSVVGGSLDGLLQQVARGGVVSLLVVDPGEGVGGDGRVGRAAAGGFGQREGNGAVAPRVHHHEGGVYFPCHLVPLGHESFFASV